MSTDDTPQPSIEGDEVTPAPPVAEVVPAPEPPKPMDEGPTLPAGFIWDQSSGRFKRAPVL